ncbi:MAG: Glycerol-3-phosphate dehydrogenase (NAD(P)+) [Candidatus Omnitrophica bacterium ADurb.Bin292]|jgi:glycerol-3-phosphate dehydrogenase (NAD(P)+)|nr:MAG: Glycerol-3-phosphate dehydrogenase (NAD(P)+) [Candidatus Omnitrophica bacterium ADurb.Bin292]
MVFDKIAVIGAGAWGTTMANYLAGKTKEVRLWTNQKDTLAAIVEKRRNDRYLPEVRLSPKIQATDDMAKAVEGCALTVWAFPVQHLRERMRQFLPFFEK